MYVMSMMHHQNITCPSIFAACLCYVNDTSTLTPYIPFSYLVFVKDNITCCIFFYVNTRQQNITCTTLPTIKLCYVNNASTINIYKVSSKNRKHI